MLSRGGFRGRAKFDAAPEPARFLETWSRFLDRCSTGAAVTDIDRPSSDAADRRVIVPESESSRSSKRDRCHGQSQRRSVGVETGRSPAKGKPGGAPRGLFALFLVNLARADLYKPMQGWYARVYTALGLGLIVAAGAWRVFDASIEYSPALRFGLPARVRWASWAGSSFGSFISRRSRSF